MSWANVLENYARLERPERELPDGVWVASDERTLTIFDGYEKAKYHMLVMPRDPFRLPSGATVPSSHLTNLRALLKSPHALEVLQALRQAGEEVSDMIRDEMHKSEGWSWELRMGFHAVESMRHVHLHVISSDMISPKLKNKKHWNSFHPTLGYFLHIDDVIHDVEGGSLELDSTKSYEALLKCDLVSHYPPHRTFATIPKLKEHLEAEFEREGQRRRASQKQESGTPDSGGAKRGGHEGEGGGDANGKGKRRRTASPAAQQSR